MKKNVNVSVEIANVVNESKKTKGAKVANSENSMKVTPTKKEMRQTFVSYICSKEEISVSKFFRLLHQWKADNVEEYKAFISAYNLNLGIDYTFDWFASNCPKDENGNFAKWTKVSEKVCANENEAYNRKSDKGVIYTLVAYTTLRADYIQFMQMFLDVVHEINRKQREADKAKREAKKAKEKAEKERKQAEKNLKAVNEIYGEIADLAKDYSLPFETAVNIYAKTKKMTISAELKAMLLEKAA